MTTESDLATAASASDPRVGLRAVRALRRLLEELERAQVRRARQQGWSWAEIGEVARGQPAGRAQEARQGLSREATMFERFTKRARAVVEGAVEIAEGAGAADVRPEHLLAAILRDEDCLATRVLSDLGADPASTAGPTSSAGARATSTGSTTRTPRRWRRSASTSRTPWSRRRGRRRAVRDGAARRSRAASKKALELSLREAIALRHNYIGTEHLLLGLVRGGDSVVLDTLAACGDHARRSAGSRGGRRTPGQLTSGVRLLRSRSRSAPRPGRAAPGRGPGSRGRRRGCASRPGRCRPGRGAASRSCWQTPFFHSTSRGIFGHACLPSRSGRTAAQMSMNGWPTISTCCPIG